MCARPQDKQNRDPLIEKQLFVEVILFFCGHCASGAHALCYIAVRYKQYHLFFYSLIVPITI